MTTPTPLEAIALGRALAIRLRNAPGTWYQRLIQAALARLVLCLVELMLEYYSRSLAGQAAAPSPTEAAPATASSSRPAQPATAAAASRPAPRPAPTTYIAPSSHATESHPPVLWAYAPVLWPHAPRLTTDPPEPAPHPIRPNPFVGWAMPTNPPLRPAARRTWCEKPPSAHPIKHAHIVPIS